MDKVIFGDAIKLDLKEVINGKEEDGSHQVSGVSGVCTEGCPNGEGSKEGENA
jgi:hypothetical protein